MYHLIIIYYTPIYINLISYIHKVDNIANDIIV